MKTNKDCNIVHNLIKDIFIDAIYKNYQYFVPILLQNT